MTTFFGNAAPLTESGFDDVRQSLGADAPSLWSLMTVETSGFGFLPDRRPKMLFERHIFHKRTNGRFDAQHPDISSATPGNYKGGEAEYRRIGEASMLDPGAALDSASWGLGQIMGFNASKLGYVDAEDMVNSFRNGEDQQLDGVRRFIHANPVLEKAFAARSWNKVAFFYNGAAYARNDYDKKLDRYYLLYKTHGTPSIVVRTAQAWLTYLGYAPRGVDGLLGDGTQSALIAYQRDHGLDLTAQPDDNTMNALQRAAMSIGEASVNLKTAAMSMH